MTDSLTKLASLLLALTLSLPCHAQEPAAAKGRKILLPVGTTIEGRMDTTISSDGSKQGQRFTIVLASPVLVQGNIVAIAAGSQIIGEVVEAVPAHKLKKVKGMAKPTGKLRVELTSISTPDGASYPFVGALAGERIVQNKHSRVNPNLGGGVGYVGSDSNFSAMTPQGRASGNAKHPTVVLRPDLAKDALYGKDAMRMPGDPSIRSLVLKKQDLMIAAGSPVTVQLEAPLTLNLHNMAQSDAMYEAAGQHAMHTGERRFSQEADPEQEMGGSSTPPTNLPFLQPKQSGVPVLPQQQPGAAGTTTPPAQPSTNSSEF